MNTHFSCVDIALAEVFLGGLLPPSSANLKWDIGCLTLCYLGQASLYSSISPNPLPLDFHLSTDC